MCRRCDHEEQPGIPRRDFVKIVGLSAAGVSLHAAALTGAEDTPTRFASHFIDREVRETHFGHYRIAYLIRNEERKEDPIVMKRLYDH